MTGTTVNSVAFGVNPVENTVTNSQNETTKNQDFGNILNESLQKQEQPRQSETAVVQADSKQKAANEPKTENEKPVQKQADAEPAADNRISEVNGKPDDDMEIDEMTVEEIADALSQIIEQIKEILGVSDEELLSGMESIGMKPVDLLDSANMTQLVTTLSGEDSSISLVANEELYTALREITQMIETTTGELLENAGLTQDELDVVLTKLTELENKNVVPDETMPMAENSDMPVQDESMISAEMANGNATETTNQTADQIPVMVEDDQQEEQSNLPKQDSLENATAENDLAEETAENDTRIHQQKPGRDESNENSPKDFEQNKNMAQNFQNELTEAVNATGENVESFTSASTERIMRQLADMVKLVKNENLTEMELQLHPASLGTVNVSLTTKGGVVTAEFVTQNETVKAAIEAQASQLQAKLEEQGVRVEAIEVSVASHQMERDLDKNNQGQQQTSQDQQAQRIQGIRRNSIHLKTFENGEELMEEMNGADDATRIAMEMMVANGNTMDLLA
ncbi:MAG: flagellar hook-length control protein FliK [Lachnospiraceae bacterium]|nr:flagellar hook-length control protein FliK [Lachnospiraceae bacterium]